MARRWEQLDGVTELMITLDHLVAFRSYDRQDGVRDPGSNGRIGLFGFSPVGKLAVCKDVLGLWKSWNPAPVLQLCVPADMIDVQVGAHDIVDLVDGDPG